MFFLFSSFSYSPFYLFFSLLYISFYPHRYVTFSLLFGSNFFTFTKDANTHATIINGCQTHLPTISQSTHHSNPYGPLYTGSLIHWRCSATDLTFILWISNISIFSQCTNITLLYDWIKYQLRFSSSDPNRNTPTWLSYKFLNRTSSKTVFNISDITVPIGNKWSAFYETMGIMVIL